MRRRRTTAPISCCAISRAASSQNIGNVNHYDFDDAGHLLAYTVDAAERSGNGVYVLDLATGQSRVLSSATADYDQLSWSDKRDQHSPCCAATRRRRTSSATIRFSSGTDAIEPDAKRRRVRSVQGRVVPEGHGA